MKTYKTVVHFIRRIKKLDKKEFTNNEIIEQIVYDSEVFPEEEKEYMLQYLKEEEGADASLLFKKESLR